MSDFSLTTLFVVPSGSTIATANSTQELTPGKVGIFKNDYSVATAGNIAAAPYFYVAQGRTNNYLQGSKRSDKIGVAINTITGNAQNIVTKSSNVTEWYKVVGNSTAVNQITEVSGWNVKCGDTVSLTLRAFSSYIETLYFNGFTRSVTVQAPCCDCGGNPCDTVDVPALIDAFIAKLEQQAVGTNPDNISFNTFFSFERDGDDANAKLVITGKPLTKYGQPCDIAAFPFEFDRMRFNTFVYAGPATTADFIVDDNCNVVATTAIVQESNYPRGGSEEVKQLEKNFYSYQAGYLKHLYRMNGYNANFESWVSDGSTYNIYYIKFNDLDKTAYQWGAYVPIDSTIVIAVVKNSAEETALSNILTAALGAPTVY